MTRIEEIYEFVLPTMEEFQIEDTTENRIAFLEGMLDAWNEDEEVDFEKTLYKLAAANEIILQKMKLNLRWR